MLCSVILALAGCSESDISKAKAEENKAPSLLSKLDINDLDFLLDIINPDIETKDEKVAAANRPYTLKEESKALDKLIENRKLDVPLHTYEDLIDKNIKHLSDSGKRDVMNELIDVIKMNESLTNAQFNSYSYEVYRLVNKYKSPNKVLRLTDIKGKHYLTDLFKESRENHMILLKKNYIDEYKVEVDYTYIKKKYGKYMDKDLKLKLDDMLYKSLQYNKLN